MTQARQARACSARADSSGTVFPVALRRPCVACCHVLMSMRIVCVSSSACAGCTIKALIWPRARRSSACRSLPITGSPVARTAAGVDVHADDALGRLALSDDGIRRRELMVLDTCLAAGVPVAGLVGGGCVPLTDACMSVRHAFVLLAVDSFKADRLLQRILTWCGGAGMLLMWESWPGDIACCMRQRRACGSSMDCES